MATNPLSFNTPGLPIGSLAPAQSIEEARRPEITPETTPFESFITGRLIKRLAREDQDLDRRRYQKGTRNVKYYEGEQNGFFGRFTNQFYTYDSQDGGDPQRVHNSFRYYSDAITTQWVQGRADLKVIPLLRDGADDHTKAAARKADQILDYYETCLLDQEFLEDECKNEQFFGGAFRLTYWDPNIGQDIEIPQFEDQQVQLGPDTYSCVMCGQQGLANEVPTGQCLNCGAPVSIEPGPTSVMPMPAQPKQGKAGDIRLEGPPPLEIKFDKSGGKFDKALWLRRRRRLRTEVVTSMIPWYKSDGGQGDAADDPGLHYQRLTRRSIGNVGPGFNYMTLSSGGTVEDGSQYTVTDQWWFACAMYSDPGLVWANDIPLAGGQVIPAGCPLKEVFPDGLYVLVVNGQILDQRNENFLDHWQYTPFISLPTRADGDGIEDMCEPQRQVNRFKALMEESSAYRSSPPTLYRSEYIKRAKYSNKPREMYPVQGLDPAIPLESLVYQPQGSQLTPEVTEFIQMLDGDMQKYSKGWSTATGAPDVKSLGAMKTATGASLMSQNANNQRAPELALRAVGDVRWAMQVLKLFQKNATYQRYLPFQGKAADNGGALFQGSDIDVQFTVQARNRSWLPKSETDRQNRLQMAIQALMMMMQVAPEIAASQAFQEHLCEIYDVPMDVFDQSDPDRELARSRIDQMTAKQKDITTASQTFGMPTPMAAQMLAGAIDPPMHPTENHQVAQKFYADWLKTREGLTAGQLLRGAVSTLIEQHMQEGMLLQQTMQGMEMQANAPKIAAAQMAQGGPQKRGAGAEPPKSGEPNQPQGLAPRSMPSGAGLHNAAAASGG